jgi:GDSL-like lipase/acylhydrolase family protein
MHRLKNFAVNVGLVAMSVAIGLLLCELVVFRFILPASDVPANAYGNDLVRYAPNQAGVWRVKNEIAAPYAINAQGWNSGVGDYVLQRTAGVPRIAVVGDSFVEALHVPNDRSIAERLAVELGRDGTRPEVYRFAVSGAPLSQYLHMIEREVLSYRPDWIVVVLVHNDFDESFQFVQGRYTSSFLKLRVKDRTIEEVPPTPWKADVNEWLRHTATARFLYYRWRVRLESIRNLLLPAARAANDRYDANVEVEPVLRVLPTIRLTTDYVLARLARLQQREGTRVLLAIDGVRAVIYSGRTSEILALNRLTAELAARHGLSFVDLQAVFSADWAAHHRRFEFESDYHWNEYAHAVAARAIAHEIAKSR